MRPVVWIMKPSRLGSTWADGMLERVEACARPISRVILTPCTSVSTRKSGAMKKQRQSPQKADPGLLVALPMGGTGTVCAREEGGDEPRRVSSREMQEKSLWCSCPAASR